MHTDKRQSPDNLELSSYSLDRPKSPGAENGRDYSFHPVIVEQVSNMHHATRVFPLTASPVFLAVLADPDSSMTSAHSLAASLAIPLVTDPCAATLLLRYSSEGLELFKPGDPSLPGSLRVNFSSPGVTKRCTDPGQELLIRATKIRHTSEPLLTDTTAGLGYDGFILAVAGFQVHMIEADPVVAALLADGLERARHNPILAPVVERISLTIGEAQDVLPRQMKHPDVIYLDPMFPRRSKSALVKQELRLLQLLTSRTTTSPEQLLHQALAVQARKVVVKRPRTGPNLLNLRPSYTIRGKAIRFDVYVGSGKAPTPLPTA